MPELADTTFAMDFLLRAKEGVRNIAVTLTESASPLQWGGSNFLF